MQYYLLSKLSVRRRKSLSGSAISLYKSPQQEWQCFNWEAKVLPPFQTLASSTRMPTLYQPTQLIFSCRAHRHWTDNSPLKKPHNTPKTLFWFSSACSTFQRLDKNTQKKTELPKRQRSTLMLWSLILVVPGRPPESVNSCRGCTPSPSFYAESTINWWDATLKAKQQFFSSPTLEIWVGK